MTITTVLDFVVAVALGAALSLRNVCISHDDRDRQGRPELGLRTSRRLTTFGWAAGLPTAWDSITH